MKRRNNKLTKGIVLCLGVISFVLFMLWVVSKQPQPISNDDKTFFSNNLIADVTPSRIPFSIIGKVIEIKVNESGGTVLVLETYHNRKALCLMHPNHRTDVREIDLGSEVKVEGVFVGFTDDIIMVSCKL